MISPKWIVSASQWTDTIFGGVIANEKVAHLHLPVTRTERRAIQPTSSGIGGPTVMAERDLTGNRAQAVLVVAVGVLLSAGVVNVLLAVVESVVWPVVVGVGWVAVAAGVVVEAEAAAAAGSTTLSLPHGSPPLGRILR